MYYNRQKGKTPTSGQQPGSPTRSAFNRFASGKKLLNRPDSSGLPLTRRKVSAKFRRNEAHSLTVKLAPKRVTHLKSPTGSTKLVIDNGPAHHRGSNTCQQQLQTINIANTKSPAQQHDIFRHQKSRPVMLSTIDDRQKGKHTLAQTLQLKQHGRAKRQLLTVNGSANHIKYKDSVKYSATPNSIINMTSLAKSPSAHVMQSQPPNSLSAVVHETNTKLQNDLLELNKIKRRQRDRYKELEEVDCADMLKTANVQIKVMNQLLDRLIPSDDSHTVINENKNYGIEVIPQNLMTFRVPSKNLHSPAKFTITFNDSDSATAASSSNSAANNLSKGRPKLGIKRAGGGLSQEISAALSNQDLRIYVSQEEKEPREGKCDATQSSQVFLVHTNNKQAKTFETSNIYISLLSIKGCSINIKVKFSDKGGHQRRRQEDKGMASHLSPYGTVEEDPNYESRPESDPFKELRRKMKEE